MDHTIWIELALLLFLAAAACEDYRCRKLPAALICAGGAAGLVLRFLFDREDLQDMILGIGIGAVMLLISYATREALGYGDGLLMGAAGIYLGGVHTLVLLMCSLLTAAIGSIVLLGTKRKKGKDQIPFAPFVLGGFVLMKGVFQ